MCYGVAEACYAVVFIFRVSLRRILERLRRREFVGSELNLRGSCYAVMPLHGYAVVSCEIGTTLVNFVTP